MLMNRIHLFEEMYQAPGPPRSFMELKAARGPGNEARVYINNLWATDMQCTYTLYDMLYSISLIPRPWPGNEANNNIQHVLHVYHCPPMGVTGTQPSSLVACGGDVLHP